MVDYSVPPSEYFDDYPVDEETDDERDAEMWSRHLRIFEFVLDSCPFPISPDAYTWIMNALKDI